MWGVWSAHTGLKLEGGGALRVGLVLMSILAGGLVVLLLYCVLTAVVKSILSAAGGLARRSYIFWKARWLMSSSGDWAKFACIFISKAPSGRGGIGYELLLLSPSRSSELL